MKKVALVFARINAAEEFRRTVNAFWPLYAGIVSGSNPISPHAHGMIKKGTEFDFRVAEDVWIGCPAGRVFFEKI